MRLAGCKEMMRNRVEPVTGTTRCTVGASERDTVIGTRGQRTTSGPAGRVLHQQAGHMTAPDQFGSTSQTTLPKGRRPHMTVHSMVATASESLRSRQLFSPLSPQLPSLPRYNSPFQTARPATDSPMSCSQSVEEEDNDKDRETYDDPEPAHDRSPSLPRQSCLALRTV